MNTSVDNYIKATTLYKLRLTLNIYVKDRFRDVPVNQLNDDDFKMYYKYLKKTKLEISTKNKYLRNLKDIFDFINIMYAYGVSVDVIQHLLGHSSSEITKQVYIHDTERKKNAMNTLINGFFKEMDSK